MNKTSHHTPDEQFDHLLAVMSSQRFLHKQGLNNEVPFYICPYDPAHAVAMERVIKQLLGQLHQKGVRVLEVNLYDLALGHLKERGLWERLLVFEQNNPQEILKEQLQSILDPESRLTPLIATLLEKQSPDILFITGVGEVFPYIRSHTVLNNLHSTAKDKPTVLFFPGEYTHHPVHGASLNLFGRLANDKYYRAYNIHETHPIGR